MIYLKLFLTFLKVGAVSFGGGYGMISLLREEILRKDWLTDSEFMSFIAVSESTPGPLAVNMATFIGSSQGGFAGALLATLGVVLPSFIIILIIAALISNLLKYAGVNAFLTGVRPCVAALILATAVTMALSTFMGIKTAGDIPSAEFGAIAIFSVLVLTGFVIKVKTKKSPSPIIMILISAILGAAVYGR